MKPFFEKILSKLLLLVCVCSLMSCVTSHYHYHYDPDASKKFKDSTLSSLILDVSLSDLENGLIDRSPYRHLQIGGISGVATYEEGGIMMTHNEGSKPRWFINKPIFPLIIEYEVNYFGIHGHGWCMEFRNADDDDWIFGQALSFSGQDKFLSANVKENEPIPTVTANKWVKVRVEYGKPVSGSGEIKIYFDGVLKSTQTREYTTQICNNFSLRYENWNDWDNADAAFKNLKIWVPKK